MARLPYLEKSDLKPEDQDLLKREITLHKALVNSPGAAGQRLPCFSASSSFDSHVVKDAC